MRHDVFALRSPISCRGQSASGNVTEEHKAGGKLGDGCSRAK